MTMNRRTFAKGAAWTAPVIATASAGPAVAASTTPTGTVSTAVNYGTTLTKTPTSCSPSTNPQVGFVDTLRCNSPVKPTNSDCRQDPNTSNGYWLEGTSGTATVNYIETVYTFNYPVKLDECPYPAAGKSYIGATTTWTSCNIYNGWTITQVDQYTIKAVYSTPTTVDVSTATAGSGWCTGYFFNFHVASGCYASGVVKRSYTTTLIYSDKNVTNKTWTKSVPLTGV